jgi:tellurite resistance protein TehA-like permease
MDYYKLGFAAGFLAVIITALILRKVLHRQPTVYDERQKMIRGIAYSYGFFGMMVAIVLYIFLAGIGVSGAVEPTLAMFIVMITGVMTYAVYSIVHGAYFGINNNRKRWIILDVAVVVINAGCAALEYMDGGMIRNGVLTLSGNANLICAAAFAAVLAALIVKERRERMENDDEES